MVLKAVYETVFYTVMDTFANFYNPILKKSHFLKLFSCKCRNALKAIDKLCQNFNSFILTIRDIKLQYYILRRKSKLIVVI